MAFITNEKNQEKIARDILNAIEKFAKTKDDNPVAQLNNSSDAGITAVQNEDSKINSRGVFKAKDTIPRKIKSVDITTDDHLIIIYSDDKAEKITKTEAKERGIVSPPVKNVFRLKGAGDSALYFVDGVETTVENVEKINPGNIDSINVYKGESAERKFGKRGKNGVIQIRLKTMNAASIVQEGDKVFLQVETEAKFPGGRAAWQKFISASIKKVIDSLQEENKPGTCVVQFIVDAEGNLSEVKPLTMEGTLFAKTVTDAIKNGPKWIPAMQNGHKVKAYHKQPVTFQIAEE
jgi:hypothetical protein